MLTINRNEEKQPQKNCCPTCRWHWQKIE